MSLEVEIGCGKGKFLVARAQTLPEIQFLGIDKALRFMRLGAARAEKRQLANLKFVRGNVLEILERDVAPQSVSVFHLYFPDPWPKRRHRHRRLLTAEFFRRLHERLVDGGLIEIATDFEDYFSEIKQTVGSGAAAPAGRGPTAGLTWGRVRESVNERLFPAVAQTNYELKYQKEGRPIYYLELQK